MCSEVSEQPVGDAETRRGACNRAKHAYDAFKADHGGRAANYSIGLEGGSTTMAARCSAGPGWLCLTDKLNMGVCKICGFTQKDTMKYKTIYTFSFVKKFLFFLLSVFAVIVDIDKVDDKKM